jgi:hypothetical protein
MKLQEHSVENVHGGHDVYARDATLLHSSIPVGHNFVDIWHHSDPLLHAADFKIPELDLNT